MEKKKLLIAVIKECADCSYSESEYDRCGSLYGYSCDHPKINGRDIPDGVDDDLIPDWCPLEHAPQQPNAADAKQQCYCETAPEGDWPCKVCMDAHKVRCLPKISKNGKQSN